MMIEHDASSESESDDEDDWPWHEDDRVVRTTNREFKLTELREYESTSLDFRGCHLGEENEDLKPLVDLLDECADELLALNLRG